MLLGMGKFFIIAALLAMLVWLATGSWRPFLEEIAIISALAVIPLAKHLWSRHMARFL